MLAAFVAITTQVVAEVAVRDVPLTEHPVPVTEKVTAPAPDPPALERVMGVPTVPVRVVLAMVRVACATELEVTDVEVALPEI